MAFETPHPRCSKKYAQNRQECTDLATPPSDKATGLVLFWLAWPQTVTRQLDSIRHLPQSPQGSLARLPPGLAIAPRLGSIAPRLGSIALRVDQPAPRLGSIAPRAMLHYSSVDVRGGLSFRDIALVVHKYPYDESRAAQAAANYSTDVEATVGFWR